MEVVKHDFTTLLEQNKKKKNIIEEIIDTVILLGKPYMVEDSKKLKEVEKDISEIDIRLNEIESKVNKAEEISDNLETSVKDMKENNNKEKDRLIEILGGIY